MAKLLKKGNYGIIAQFHALQVIDNPTQYIHPDLELVLDKHYQIFKTPMGLNPFRAEHDRGIPLIPGSQPPNVHPYRHLFAQKNKIENIIQELLEVGIICSSTSPYLSPAIMV